MCWRYIYNDTKYADSGLRFAIRLFISAPSLIVILSLWVLLHRTRRVHAYALAQESLLNLSTGACLCKPGRSYIWLMQHHLGSA